MTLLHRIKEKKIAAAMLMTFIIAINFASPPLCFLYFQRYNVIPA